MWEEEEEEEEEEGLKRICDEIMYNNYEQKMMLH